MLTNLRMHLEQISLQNRHIFLHTLGQKRRKQGEHEARVTRKGKSVKK